MGKIDLQGAKGFGKSAIVDDDLLPILSTKVWYWQETNRYNYGRVVCKVGRKVLSIHHFILGKPAPGFVVEHRNGNTLDNRKENLSFVTQQQNMRSYGNTKKGYYYDKSRGTYQVSLTSNYKRINGGRFNTEEEAAKRAEEIRNSL